MKQVKKVQVLFEKDSSSNGGVINVYVLPLKANGDRVKYNGGFLTFGASFYYQNGGVAEAPLLALEPGVPEPPPQKIAKN